MWSTKFRLGFSEILYPLVLWWIQLSGRIYCCNFKVKIYFNLVNGGSKFLWNFSIYLQEYKMPQFRTQHSDIHHHKCLSSYISFNTKKRNLTSSTCQLQRVRGNSDGGATWKPAGGRRDSHCLSYIRLEIFYHFKIHEFSKWFIFISCSPFGLDVQEKTSRYC
jgi:hypothetical protein